MDSLCLFSVLQYIFLQLKQIKTSQPKKDSASPCYFIEFLVLSICSFSGMVSFSLPSCFLHCICFGSCISSIHVYIFHPVFLCFLLSTLFFHCISWERKGAKKITWTCFLSTSYPYYTVLRNKAGIEKAGFQKPVVRELSKRDSKL